MAAQEFVRIDFDGTGTGEAKDASRDGRRKLRFKHRDLRELVELTNKSLSQLLDDQWAGWPYLLLFGLREADPSLTLNKCSDLIDMWVRNHPDEEFPMKSLGDKLREAFEAAGFVRQRRDDEAPPVSGGNGQPG